MKIRPLACQIVQYEFFELPSAAKFMGLEKIWQSRARGPLKGRRLCSGGRTREKESAGLLVSLVGFQNGNIRGIIRQPPEVRHKTSNLLVKLHRQTI